MAKTAQVKQYKKQTDSYKAKLDEATSKLLRTQLELQQLKDLVKTTEEENQYRIKEARARAESDKLAAETDMIKSQRKIEHLERELQAITSEGNIPETVKVEIRRRLEVEQKLRAAEEKINQLFDKCDSRYHAIEELKQTLNKHKIPIPPFAMDKVNLQTPKEQRKVDLGLQQLSSPKRDVQHQPMLSPRHGPHYNIVPHYKNIVPQQAFVHSQQGQQQFVPAAHSSQGVPSSSAPTGRGQQNPKSTPTPLPRRNLSITGRPKMTSDVQENSLLQGIDQDIKEAAKFVIQETELMGPEAPFDPNLICPLCRRNFRKGEIQKYKRHVRSCHSGQL